MNFLTITDLEAKYLHLGQLLLNERFSAEFDELFTPTTRPKLSVVVGRSRESFLQEKSKQQARFQDLADKLAIASGSHPKFKAVEKLLHEVQTKHPGAQIGFMFLEMPRYEAVPAGS